MIYDGSFAISSEYDSSADNPLIRKGIGRIVIIVLVPERLGCHAHALALVLGQHDLDPQLVPGHFEFLGSLADHLRDLFRNVSGSSGVVVPGAAELLDCLLQHCSHLRGVELFVLLWLELVCVLRLRHLLKLYFFNQGYLSNYEKWVSELFLPGRPSRPRLFLPKPVIQLIQHSKKTCLKLLIPELAPVRPPLLRRLDDPLPLRKLLKSIRLAQQERIV
jgi:hypothetical protein